MAVKTDHPTPSVAFVVFNDCQVVSSLCGCLKHVSNCGLGMPPLAHHVGTLQQAVEDVQQHDQVPSTSDRPLVTQAWLSVSGMPIEQISRLVATAAHPSPNSSTASRSSR